MVRIDSCRLGSPVSGFPISYAVDGKQYAAFGTAVSVACGDHEGENALGGDQRQDPVDQAAGLRVPRVSAPRPAGPPTRVGGPAIRL